MSARLSLTAIVKNEAQTLSGSLTSIRDIVDDIVVVDTGSSDHSKDIALQHGARVFDLPWPDSFAAARNESIRHATGQWLLWLDADEYFDEANREKLRQLVAELNDDNTAYVMPNRLIPRRRKAIGPGQIEHPRTMLQRDVLAVIAGASVHHDDVVDDVSDRGEALRQRGGFVLHN